MRSIRWAVIGVLLGVTPTALGADQEQSKVVENSFCIKKSNLACDEFVGSADGGKVAINRLPTIATEEEEHAHILYFHSAQRMASGATVAHVWKSEDEEAYRPRASYYVTDGAKHVSTSILDTFVRYVQSLHAGNWAIIFRNPEADVVEDYRTWSRRIVYGPGKQSAFTATAEGIILPGSREQSVTVVQ